MDDTANTSNTTDAPQQEPARKTVRGKLSQRLQRLPRVPIVKRVFWRRISSLIAVIIIAGAAGFVGGRVGDQPSTTSSTLAGQRQIITSQGQLINKIAKDVGPSVVSVNVVTQSTASDFFGFGDQSTNQRAAGTGIIISRDGVIMTNRHVVPSGTTEVSVTLSDGTQYDNVEVLGRTSSSDSLDVAFLKIKDLKGRSLSAAAIGNSAAMSVGDSVVAIGNALGEFQNTVTSGIISGFGRQVQAGSDGGEFGASDTEDLGNLIQTDAAINEGNSGGPLVNMNGQVIGINTAIASDAQNVGFAIPINDVKGLIHQVLQTGSFSRPYLGVRYISLTAAISKEYALPVDSGAYVAPRGVTGSDPILPGSPADKAGLRAGDIITAVNGSKLGQQKSLTTMLNKFQPGDKVSLLVLRAGKTLTISATLGRMSDNN
jgi:S1-C subfamily serine protease